MLQTVNTLARRWMNRFRWYGAKMIKKKYIKSTILGRPMILDLANDGISYALSVYGIREEDHIAIVQYVIKPGDIVLDIGANIGFYALMEADLVGASGHVYAIEPDTRNLALLEKNVALNEFQDRITIHPGGMSDHDGIEKMYVAQKTNLNTFVSPDDHAFLAPHLVADTADIHMTSIDAFVQKHNIKPTMIRMDIEGYEVEVLRGARETLAGAETFAILMELHPDAYSPDHSLEAELRYLFDHGFEPSVLVSASVPQPKMYKERGYEPSKLFHTDGFVRAWYEGVSREDAIALACATPKVSRYILLQKHTKK